MAGERASGRCRPHRLYADAGYDAEKVHAFCRDGWGVASWIPPVPRGGHGVVRSGHRARVAAAGLPAGYGRRWHVEAFISGMKRSTGSQLRARSLPAMMAEATLRALAYAVRR